MLKAIIIIGIIVYGVMALVNLGLQIYRRKIDKDINEIIQKWVCEDEHHR